MKEIRKNSRQKLRKKKNSGGIFKGTPKEVLEKLLNKLRSKSWKTRDEILGGVPGVTLKEFPQELWMNY